MADIENVSSDLEQQIRWIEEIECHKFPGWLNTTNAMRDALELLKEQVPLEPYASEGDMKCGNGCEIVGYIRESDGKIERLANYCPYCGRPVKWD